MSRRNIYQTLFIALIPLTLQIKTAFPQGADQLLVKNKNPDSSEILSNESIKNAVKKAINESDEEKEKRHAQLLSELKSKLNKKAQEWIIFSRHSREAELNRLQHTTWNLTSLVNYPVPYDYYLRGYDYLITREDLETGSLLSPYKANIDISEKLYVEGIHSSDANDRRQYYYTLNRIIVLSLEYKLNKFIITNTEYGLFQIEPNWQKN